MNLPSFTFPGPKRYSSLFEVNIVPGYGQKQSGDRYMAWSFTLQACGHFLEGDFLSAIDYFKQAINISVDPIYSLNSKFLMGLSFVSCGRMNDAESVLKEVIKYSEGHGIEIWGSSAHSIQAILLLAKGSLNKGIKLLEIELQAYLESDLKYRYAYAQNTLGNVYFQILRKTGPKSLAVFVTNIPFLIKNVPLAAKKAEFHLNKAIEVANKIGAKNVLGQAYLNLGLLHKIKKRSKEASEYLSKAIKIFEESEARTYLKQANEVFDSLR